MTRSALANLFALSFQIHHNVCYRDGEALSSTADDALLKPVRPAFGMGRDDDLVGAESAERVLAAPANRVAQRLAADGLVCDHENPPLVLGRARPRRCEDPGAPFAAAEVEEEH